MIYSFIYFFYRQVNHKFEGRSVGEDSLRQMFVESHALIQSTSGSYVRWVWGVCGPQRPSPLSLMRSHTREVFVPAPRSSRVLSSSLTSVHALLSDVEHFISICHMWEINLSLNRVLIGRVVFCDDWNFSHFLKDAFSRPRLRRLWSDLHETYLPPWRRLCFHRCPTVCLFVCFHSKRAFVYLFAHLRRKRIARVISPWTSVLYKIMEEKYKYMSTGVLGCFR